MNYCVLCNFAPHRTGDVRFGRKIACGLVFQATWRFNPNSYIGIRVAKAP